MEGGIEPERIGFLTFREVDWIMQREKAEKIHDWQQTRLIVAALTGQKPEKILPLPGDPKPKKWTHKEAINVLKSYGERR